MWPEQAVPLGDAPVVAHAGPHDARLFELQWTFNMFPATYIHDSWLKAPGWRWCREGEGERSSLWTRQFSAAVLRQWRLDRQFDWDFSDRGKRLALIDAATLRRLGELASAVLMRDGLRRLVSREEVQAMQDVLGVQTHLYAVRWHRPLPGLAEDTIGASPLDIVVGAGKWRGDAMALQIAAHRQRCAQLLNAAIPEAAHGVRERLRLKLPCGWARECQGDGSMSEAQRRGLLRLFIAVIADVCPQWSWLFAPRAEVTWRSQEIPPEAVC